MGIEYPNYSLELALKFLAENAQNFSGKDDQLRNFLYEYEGLCHHLFNLRQTIGDNEMTRAGGIGITTNRQAIIDASIIPLTENRNELISDFTKWATLYSELPLYILPFSISKYYDETYDSWGGGDALSFSKREILEFIQINRQYNELIRLNKAVFLPQSFKSITNAHSDFMELSYEAPLIQVPDKFIFMPINSGNKLFTGKSFQEFLIYKQLILPYFKLSDINELIKIAKNETEAFKKFNHYLAGKLVDISQIDTPEKLNSILLEIDYEVTNVELEYKKLSKLKVLQGIEIGFLAISLCALSFSNIDIVQQIAGLSGSISLLDMIKDYATYQQNKIDIKKSDFYLPFLLKSKT